ncbi:hypothetical protein MTP99_017859 [Tenebrio molitor]|nr:hypothetical protein MTP99_017859 [Tenebrio molitor]
MYVTPEKIKDALRALPRTIIGHSPESWSVEEPEKTYPAIKLICDADRNSSSFVHAPNVYVYHKKTMLFFESLRRGRGIDPPIDTGPENEFDSWTAPEGR